MFLLNTQLASLTKKGSNSVSGMKPSVRSLIIGLLPTTESGRLAKSKLPPLPCTVSAIRCAISLASTSLIACLPS